MTPDVSELIFYYDSPYLVQIQWRIDWDGAKVTEDSELRPASLIGGFFTLEEAQHWIDIYPDRTDVHKMQIVSLNRDL